MKTEDLKFFSNDLDKEIIIKDYLKELLSTLWKEEACFSGKRPFGNSGWQHEVYTCLVKNNIIKGSIDEDGYIDDIDTQQADNIICEIINKL